MRSFLLLVVLAVGCAHEQPPQAQAAPAQAQQPEELIVGFRPNATPPPETIETMKRLDSTCWYTEHGPAACVYISRVAYVTEWFCGMGYGQASASEEWMPRKMACQPWTDDYQRLLDNPQGLHGDSSSDHSSSDQ